MADYIKTNETKKRKISIETLSDILSIIRDKSVNINSKNRERLAMIEEPITKLNEMIGLNEVKKSIVGQILYFIQELSPSNNDMMHTCIMGSPGTGKTELAKIVAEIYKKLGFLSSDKFKIVKRSDLIGRYLGETAIKTQKVLDDCKGGVLFIDEAYSLGHEKGDDSYSKECIDTITAHLTECKSDFVCIIAGYKDSLERCFFSINPGLERRFPWKYEIKEYTSGELLSIFKSQVENNDWILDKDAISCDFFEKNKKYFTCYGGDTETFFCKCKIEHSKRVFCLPRRYRKIVNEEDIRNGFEEFKKNKNIVEDDVPPPSMYM